MEELTSCPFCGSKTGYEVVTISRLTTWNEWSKEAVNTEVDLISGGRQAKCMDCRKIVTKYINTAIDMDKEIKWNMQ